MFRRLDDKSFSVSYVLCLALCLLALGGCETRHVGSLSPVETPVPDAQPCGEGCPDGTVCVPIINDDGEPIFSCIDVHLRYCSPCLEDNDCIDPYMPEAGSLCVGWEDGSGSFCATDCSQHADCPDGAFCKVREDGRAVCMPEGGECSCSQWAIDNEARTRCSTTNTHGTCSGVRVCEPDGLTDCDAVTPVQEVCNGADDNCDGLADDIFPEQEVACDGEDPDQCNDGTTVCIDGALACVDESPEGAEACNGLDDDCDGEVDNLDPVMADLQAGVCVGSLKVCLGVDGWEEPDYTLIEKFEVGEEVTCDDLDNDCDGDTDEPYAEGGTITYTDPSGAIGLVKGAPCGVGACAGGDVVCAEDGQSLSCSTGDLRVVEICDGIDNDCDGEVDEDLTPHLGDRQDGVCMGSVRTCQGTLGWVEPDYALIEGFELDEVSCDGLDNDCDGTDDELFIAGGSITYTDVDGTLGLVKGQHCGAGACEGGLVICGEDTLSLTCSTVGLVTDEVCDGADNDCNGGVDDALTEPEAALQAGVCEGALRVCGGAAGWVEPTYGAIAGFELTEVTCDGLDNDCDGEVDDSLQAPPAEVQAGVCGGSVKVCVGSGGWIEPVYTQVEGYESTELTCDGRDNDCDGETDEALLAPMANVQFGVCAGTQKVCGGIAGWTEPDYASLDNYEAQEVSCDGRDNDCDGLADNGLVAPAAPLSVGVCAGQVMLCGGANGWFEPAYAAIAGYELDELSCDGLDNDCDGFSDEALNAPLADIQGGVCMGAIKVCGGGAGWVEPSYTSIVGFEAIEVTCDANDNDCDGQTDEQLDAPLAAVQVGVCAGALQLCEAGVWVEPAYESVAGFEQDESLCDGLDNDCDGDADEALTAPAADLQIGVCVNSVKVCGAADGWGEPDYTLVEGYEVEEQSCDAIDNDCDGAIDELFAQDGVITFTDTNGTTGLVLGDACGAGACTGGVVTCAPDAESLTCSSWGEVEVESCNGFDDDCDGNTDEGLTAPGANLQAGVCAGATRVCGGASGWLEPSYDGFAGYESLEQSCDGLDNDCDGSVDESLAPPAASLTLGVCAGAAKLCSGAGGWVDPNYGLLAGYEINEQSCDGLDNDCDGVADEGYDLAGDINNCGSCGNVCSLPNATAACSEGGCVIAACDAGFEDCNGNPVDGCEVYTINDPDNCGSCGNVCTNDHGGMMCSGGQCAPTCDNGWADCNDDLGNGFTDGCETMLGTLTDCSSCGDACNAPNGYPICNPDADGYSCGLEACAYGYCDGDGNPANGCDFAIDSEPDPVCENAIDMGAISGDMGGYVMVSGAAGEYWLKVRMTEDDSEWFAPKPPGVTVTLDPGSFTDYDLYVYYGSCGGDLYSSANWEGTVEQISISWDDEWFPIGYDDSEDIYVLVKFFEAAPFYDTSSEQVACYPWSLLIEGYNYQ